MTVYLTIITTILVLTQIVRITQNHFQLKNQGKAIEAELKHLKSYRDIDSYAELQQRVFLLLYDWLKRSMIENPDEYDEEYEHEQ